MRLKCIKTPIKGYDWNIIGKQKQIILSHKTNCLEF